MVRPPGSGVPALASAHAALSARGDEASRDAGRRFGKPVARNKRNTEVFLRSPGPCLVESGAPDEHAVERAKPTRVNALRNKIVDNRRDHERAGEGVRLNS